jgi:ribosomal protein L24E
MTATETRTCRHCGEPIKPSLLFGWVHIDDSVGHFCASNKVNERAEPAGNETAR